MKPIATLLFALVLLAPCALRAEQHGSSQPHRGTGRIPDALGDSADDGRPATIADIQRMYPAYDPHEWYGPHPERPEYWHETDVREYLHRLFHGSSPRRESRPSDYRSARP